MKAAFEKIKAGLGDVSAYLDGSGDKSVYRFHVPACVSAVEKEPVATRALGKSR